ncbi:MAG: hypothetical protein U5L45_10610 [Saprospiraceae bacterium]|nr:hypothetical protein [Saprospiraceae bacterium]
MVHFSGFARKMNHISYFCASEASAKVPFNAYFEFMYGFKISFKKIRLHFFLKTILPKISKQKNIQNGLSLQKKARTQKM